jgi:hypothetical protein
VQQLSTRADINVALPVEDKVGAAEGAIGACRLVPHRDVRCDLTVYQPLEQPDRAINGVACEPLGPQTKAASDALHHGLSDSDLHDAVGAGPFGIDDDPSLVVDQIVRIIGKERVHARSGNPTRLWVGQ